MSAPLPQQTEVKKEAEEGSAEKTEEASTSGQVVKKLDDKEKGNIATAAAAALSAAAVKAKVVINQLFLISTSCMKQSMSVWHKWKHS